MTCLSVETDESNDRNFTNFLNRTTQNVLKIGLDKIQHKKTPVEFCGSQFTTDRHKTEG